MGCLREKHMSRLGPPGVIKVEKSHSIENLPWETGKNGRNFEREVVETTPSTGGWARKLQ